ncbi:MAG: UshA-like (seleno)protein [Thermodesulfobacteriota bacterium]
MGGLSKKSSLLQSLATPENDLKIDAGTLFFDDKLYRQPQRIQQSLITASALVQAYNHMEYDAVAIGRQDLAAGPQALQTLAHEASFPFLSANIVDMEGALLFKEIVHLKRAGMRIALIGLTGQAKLPDSGVDALKILAWQDVLPDLLKRAAGKSDLVILLSNLSAADNKEISRQHSDVHLIFQSGVSKQNLRPQQINNTLISQSGHDGKYQGQLTVNWTSSKKWQQGEHPILALRKEYDRLGWLINRVQKKGGPKEVYKDNETRQKDFAKKLKRYQELEVELKKITAEEKKNSVPKASHSNHFHPLPPSVPDDAVMIKLLQESRKKANQVRRQTAETKKLDQYLGSQQCRSCHEQLYTAWAKTPHASSYQTLQERDQNNNLTCVYCHVTGLDETTAYLATSLPTRLLEVGCEVCHGPGQMHAENPKQNSPSKIPNPRLCTNCHAPDRDDNFDFQVKKGKIH